MMNRKNAYQTDDSFRLGAGYLYFMGVLQIIAGGLNLAFSAFSFALADDLGAADLFTPGRVVDAFVQRGIGWPDWVVSFMAVQVVYGWIFGLLMIVAGICCLRRRARRFVWVSTIANLFNMPHGATVAFLVWHGLTRPRIAAAFDPVPKQKWSRG